MKNITFLFLFISSIYAYSSTTDNTIILNDTIVLEKKTLLKSFFPEGEFLNDSVILRNQSSYNIYDGSEVVYKYRTEILKEYLFDVADGGETASDYLLAILASHNTRIITKDSTKYNSLYQGVLFRKSNNDKAWKSFRQMKPFYVSYDISKVTTSIQLFYDIDGYHLQIAWINQMKEALQIRQYNAYTLLAE